jgi:hypothetical protein
MKTMFFNIVSMMNDGCVRCNPPTVRRRLDVPSPRKVNKHRPQISLIFAYISNSF